MSELAPVTGAVAAPPAALPSDVLAWLAAQRTYGTRETYRRNAAAWLRWCDDVGIDWLTARRRHVDVWRETLAQAGLSPATIAQRLSAVSSLYAYLVSDQVLAANPAKDVARPSRDATHAETPALDEREAVALMAAAGAPGETLRTKVGVGILMTMCLRISELDAADVTDLGVERGQRILTVTRKGEKRQKVVMPPAVWDDLEMLLAGRATGPLLVTSTGRRVGRAAWHRTVRRLALAADIPPETAAKIGPHALRRTGATVLLDAGKPVQEVQELLGHADPRTTMLYSRTRKALEKQGQNMGLLAALVYE